MNNNTKIALQEFAQAVIELTIAVSSVCGTDTAKEVVTASAKLQDALAQDETILDVK
jgi:hypothetical protein